MARRVLITHPFHPRTGQEFEFVATRYNAGEARICMEDAEGQLVWLPRRWTSLESASPFVEAAAGRSAFQTQDLLDLAEMIEGLRALATPPGELRDV